MVKAVFDAPGPAPHRIHPGRFTVRITDDVTRLSLAGATPASARSRPTFAPSSMASAPTAASAPQDAIKIIGDHTDSLRPGLYFVYDFEESGSSRLAPARQPHPHPLLPPGAAGPPGGLPPMDFLPLRFCSSGPARQHCCSTAPFPQKRWRARCRRRCRQANIRAKAADGAKHRRHRAIAP